MVLSFESVNGKLVRDHSNEAKLWNSHSCDTVYSAVPGVYNSDVCGWNSTMTPFQ